jgi:branched-chain amino acid transport system substrate-binding protein
MKGEQMVKKRILFILLALMLAVSVGLIGCGGGGEQEEEEEEEEGPTELLLGACLPETGQFAGFGQQGWGMQKAVDDINAEGGIYLSEWGKTVPVRLVIKNNESDAAKVGPLTTDLVLTDGVHALLSPDAPCDMHDPTTVVANQYGIPQVIPGGPLEPWYFGSQGGVAPDYTWFSGFSIGVPQPAPRDVDGYTMVDTWFKYMDEVDAAANTNMIAGVFACNDNDGSGWYADFPGLMEGYGMTVIGAEEELGLYADDPTQDFTSIVQAWMDADVEIIWGNSPGPHFGALWSTCVQMGFRPKIVCAARAALFPTDVLSWGLEPPLGWGVGIEVWWSPHYAVADGFVGIGGRTAASLAEDWATESGEPLNRGIGHGYHAAQIMLDAVERAGDVDGDAINAALAETDLDTISGWVKFDPETHFSAQPLSFGQWFSEDDTLTLYIVSSALDFIPEEREPIFPLDTLF